MSPIPPGWRFEINKEQLSSARWTRGTPIEHLELAAGEVLLKVDRFGLTANNITYALYGDSFGYWEFFPGATGWGIIPVWGYADAIQSCCASVSPGERLFGYLPMAEYLVIRPERTSDAYLPDGAEHRTTLPPTYNEYRRVAFDPRHGPPFEGVKMLLKPLVTLAWLVANLMTDSSNFGAR